MKKGIFTGLVLAVISLGGFAFATNYNPLSDQRIAIEKEVSANLMRVRINGEWQEFQMTPLADHLCRGSNPSYRRYCDEI